MQRSLLLFENSIHSSETKRVYMWALNRFMKFYKIRDYDSLVGMDQNISAANFSQIIIRNHIQDYERIKSYSIPKSLS